MVDFSNLINLQIEIFILIFIGYFLTQKGIITKASRQTLTDLVIDVILPANIINSYMIEFNMEILRSCAVVFVASIVIQFSYTIFNKILYPFVKREQLNVLKYATLCSNAGFLGNPLVEGIYGPTSIARELLRRVINEAKEYGCGTVQITASDMGVKLYADFGFVHNDNFMQYKI